MKSKKFNKTKELYLLERKFVLSKTIDKWTSSYNLSSLEKQAKLNNNRYLKIWVMSKWKKTLKLQELCQSFILDSNQSLTKRYLLQWLVTQNSIETADANYNKICVRFAFKKMKLKLVEIESRANSNFLLAKKVLKLWRLKLLDDAYSEDKLETLKRSILNQWRKRLSDFREADAKFDQAGSLFIVKPFLKNWINRTKQIKQMKNKAVSYHIQSTVTNDELLVKRTFIAWVSKLCFRYMEGEIR
ncbi:unnamed protein product [Ambrosiozyma monospora]|uniref:Unnamed protein product n=1 Tax=Ambrosiozyma monospora TaxID=43982 RepID=A0ACB5TUN7_AMBMO|nr:unnamed protein product [Ambrosiozyma monospora]